MFAGKKSAQIREILISESAWEEMTCLFAPSQEEKIDLNSKWLKDNMPRLLTQAMDNPTPENLSRFYTAQRLMLDIGTRFSDKSKDYFLKNPMMSEKRVMTPTY
ncbi:conjugal transfer protein TraF [Escherichia coli]|nr:conjugal transfer protein TraF [Escherichia coli]